MTSAPIRSEPPPFYFIYGERSREIGPRFIHVERVSDRTALTPGDMRRHVHPHRHPHLHQLSFWLNGDGAIAVDGKTHGLARETLTWMPSGVVHGFDIAQDCDAIVISMSDDFLRECLGGMDADPISLFVRSPLVAPLDAPLAERIRRCFDEIEREYAVPAWAQSHMIGANARLILIAAARLARSGDNGPQAQTAGSLLLARFLALLDETFREHWTIEAYAAALGTTPYLLNRATCEGVGVSASSMARARLLQEAKRLLLYTSLSAAEIGFALGFQDPAHFGRLFRKAVGDSPARWRGLHAKDLEGALSPTEQIQRDQGLSPDAAPIRR